MSLLCRQPEVYAGVTAEEFQALRASGKIDAYGFSTSKEQSTEGSANFPDEPAATPTEEAASPEESSAASLQASVLPEIESHELPAVNVDRGVLG